VLMAILQTKKMRTLISSIIALARNNRYSAIFFLMLVISPLIGGSVVAIILQSSEVEILRQASVLKICLVYLILGFSMAFGITPTTIVAYATGFVWGWQAVPHMIIAYGFAQWLGYKAAKLTGADSLLKSIIELDYYQSNLLILNAIRNQWLLVFFCRLSPVLPFGIMNYVLSVMQMKLKPFLIAGLLGMLPRTLFFIWIGVESESLLAKPPSEWGDKGIWVLLSIVSVFIIMKILTKEFKKSITVSESVDNA